MMTDENQILTAGIVITFLAGMLLLGTVIIAFDTARSNYCGQVLQALRIAKQTEALVTLQQIGCGDGK